ncbi:MAG: T9SS type B sorting domain-containing protein, partial [Flavobacterium sp.]
LAPAVLYSGLSAAQHTFVWTKDGIPLTATGGSITVTEPGRYSVTAVNRTTGCEGIASATVGVSSIATATATVGLDFHNNQTITVSVTGGSGIYEYQLDNGAFQDEPYFTNVTEGEHIVIVKDKQGCGESDPIYVYSLDYPRFFTPNADTYNDTWNIKGLRDQPESEIYIFDRYGKIITLIKPSGAGWDGMYNGSPLPATDYWFTLSYRSSDGQMKEFKAHFSLKR